MGHAIRASDSRLHRIDASILEFLACEDMVPAGIPLVPILPVAATLREETTSSCLSLKEEIDKFRFKEEEDQGDQIIPISYAEDEPDKLLGVQALILMVAYLDSSSEEEEKALNALRCMRQPDLFLSLKRDLAMVSS